MDGVPVTEKDILLTRGLPTLKGSRTISEHGSWVEDAPSVARLRAFDAEHSGSCLVETLRAYLDHFGDVSAASRALSVHSNSLRYRLRRIAQVSGLDLADPDARLLAQLQLRLSDEGGAQRG